MLLYETMQVGVCGNVPAYVETHRREHCAIGLAPDPDWHAPDDTVTRLTATDPWPVGDVGALAVFMMYVDQIGTKCLGMSGYQYDRKILWHREIILLQLLSNQFRGIKAVRWMECGKAKWKTQKHRCTDAKRCFRSLLWCRLRVASHTKGACLTARCSCNAQGAHTVRMHFARYAKSNASV